MMSSVNEHYSVIQPLLDSFSLLSQYVTGDKQD
jgi:hypothetical protein